MPAKVLVAASSATRAKTLAKALRFLRRGVDTIVGTEQPKSWSSYRLLVAELGPRLGSVKPLLMELPAEAHVVVVPPKMTVESVALHVQDPRVNHLLRKPADLDQLSKVADKLATGAIFGLERYLPEKCDIVYRRLQSYKERCAVVDELSDFVKKKRLRGSIKRAAPQVAEELLMNAMYQAPIDEEGERVFADITPSARLRRRTPRPVSIRWAVHSRALYLAVRDRFGSLARADLVQYLLRCSTQTNQIERKKLGAGIGLYLIASTVSRMLINLLPGGVTEFICTFEPGERAGLELFSFTAQRPQQNANFSAV